MDYLKILDDRRKREVAAALRRLKIDAAILERDRNVLNNTYPGILDWVSSMEDKSRKVEALYTQVYIGLRRWVSPRAELIPLFLLTDISDIDQRDAPKSVQQAQLHSYAQHPISSHVWFSAHDPADGHHLECSAECFFPVHSGR